MLLTNTQVPASAEMTSADGKTKWYFPNVQVGQISLERDGVNIEFNANTYGIEQVDTIVIEARFDQSIDFAALSKAANGVPISKVDVSQESGVWVLRWDKKIDTKTKAYEVDTKKENFNFLL